MNERKDLNYYKNLPYDVIVRKKGGLYLVFIPELSLVEEDEHFDKAHEKLEKAKEKYFREAIERGYKDYIKEPETNKIILKDTYGLIPFFVKLAIVLVILLFSVKVVLNTAPSLIKDRVSVLIKEPERLLLRFNEIMERKTPEERKVIKKYLHRAVENIRPYTDELRVLSDDKPANKE